MTLSSPFTVETFNGHDNTQPVRAATFVGLQERGAKWTNGERWSEPDGWVGETLAAVQARGPQDLTMWYPVGLQEAIGWDPKRFELDAKGREFLHHSGTYYGHPNTTPDRWALWIKGTLDGVHKVAVINTHLINNAWGEAIRGERRLRRKLWRKAWRIVKRLRRRLEAEGYVVFIIGDLNRVLKFWETTFRVLGAGFDRIFYPAAVDQLEAWYGDDNGSDHRPLFGKFRFKPVLP